MTRKQWSAIVKWSRGIFAAREKGIRETEKEAGRRFDEHWPISHGGWLWLGQLGVEQANLPAAKACPLGMVGPCDNFLKTMRDEFKPSVDTRLIPTGATQDLLAGGKVTAFHTSSRSTVVHWLNDELAPAWQDCELYVADVEQGKLSPIVAWRAGVVRAIMMPVRM